MLNFFLSVFSCRCQRCCTKENIHKMGEQTLTEGRNCSQNSPEIIIENLHINNNYKPVPKPQKYAVYKILTIISWKNKFAFECIIFRITTLKSYDGREYDFTYFCLANFVSWNLGSKFTDDKLCWKRRWLVLYLFKITNENLIKSALFIFLQMNSTL